MRKMPSPIKDRQPTTRHSRMSLISMPNRNDPISRPPHEQRRNPPSQITAIKHSNHLPTNIDHRPQRTKKSRPSSPIPQRHVPLPRIPRVRPKVQQRKQSRHPGHAGEQRQHQLSPRRGREPQQRMHIPINPTTGHQNKPRTPLRKLIGELHSHAAPERVTNNRHPINVEDPKKVTQTTRISRRRIVRPRLVGPTMTKQIRRDDGVALSQRRQQMRPGAGVITDPVHEQQRRPTAGHPVGPAVAVDHPVTQLSHQDILTPADDGGVTPPAGGPSCEVCAASRRRRPTPRAR
jgi:hypothetical protein